MRKQSLVLLIVGLAVGVVLPSVVPDGLPDLANGMLRGVGIGLLALSVIMAHKSRRARPS